MVHPKLSAVISWLDTNWKPEKGSWVFVLQILVGFFFLGAAIFKVYNYFILADQSLAQHFQYWLDSGWPPKWYARIMKFWQPYDKPIAAMVILMQGIPALMMIANIRVRTSALFLLALQLMIFMGTFNHTNFNEFVGSSVWVSLFYVLKPAKPSDFNRQLWRVMTFLLFLIIALQVHNRHNYQDHLMLSYDYQREQLAADIMSVSVYLKLFFLWVTSLPGMAYLWVGTWYLRVVLTIGMLTPWRLYAMAISLVMWIFNVSLWTNGITSQGVLWVLTVFVWLTMDQHLQFVDRQKKPATVILWRTRLQQAFGRSS